MAVRQCMLQRQQVALDIINPFNLYFSFLFSQWILQASFQDRVDFGPSKRLGM